MGFQPNSIFPDSKPGLYYIMIQYQFDFFQSNAALPKKSDLLLRDAYGRRLHIRLAVVQQRPHHIHTQEREHKSKNAEGEEQNTLAVTGKAIL